MKKSKKKKKNIQTKRMSTGSNMYRKGSDTIKFKLLNKDFDLVEFTIIDTTKKKNNVIGRIEINGKSCWINDIQINEKYQKKRIRIEINGVGKRIYK